MIVISTCAIEETSSTHLLLPLVHGLTGFSPIPFPLLNLTAGIRAACRGSVAGVAHPA